MYQVLIKITEKAVIVFAKGYHEPEDDTVKGKKKDKESKWVAFFPPIYHCMHPP
jgi:hypothetical protein